MTLPVPGNVAPRPDSANRNEGILGGLWAYFSPMATQWYFPLGTRGPLWNFVHGNGWRTA